MGGTSQSVHTAKFAAGFLDQCEQLNDRESFPSQLSAVIWILMNNPTANDPIKGTRDIRIAKLAESHRGETSLYVWYRICKSTKSVELLMIDRKATLHDS
jgi:hypothetical protein